MSADYRQQEEIEQQRRETTMEVYRAINLVHQELSKIGIQKDSKNKFDNYMFRGIDAVYNTVSPILAKHGLLILQRVLDCSTVERLSKDGKTLFFSTVNVEFDLVSCSDGSKHTIKTVGEGMDRSDKSINKALTAAYKYALFQCFCIPTESTEADKESNEVKSKEELTPSSSRWSGAVEHYRKTKNIREIKKLVHLSTENELELIYQASQGEK